MTVSFWDLLNSFPTFVILSIIALTLMIYLPKRKINRKSSRSKK